MKSIIHTDLVIVGSGIVGSGVAFTTGVYTNIESIYLLERGLGVASVNSNWRMNSQTNHDGSIETNYGLAKALEVKEAHDLIAGYLRLFDHDRQIHRRGYKMLLGVGEEEVLLVRKRFEEFKSAYPYINFIERDEIGWIEPNVVLGRNSDEPIVAIYIKEGYYLDFGKLAMSFVEKFLDSAVNGKTREINFNTEIKSVRKIGDLFVLNTNRGEFHAKTVVICAGHYSLSFAHKMGIGKDLAIMPVAGSFFTTPTCLSRKIYTVAIDGIPFAYVHGDQDVNNPDITRFGPKAKALPMFERGRYKTFFDFLSFSMFSLSGLLTFLKITFSPTFFFFAIENCLYDLRWTGKFFFWKNIKKIVPSTQLSRISCGEGLGSIRHQIVDPRTAKINLGESELVGEKIIFNVIPSPGATNCLKNARADAKLVVSMLGDEYFFDEDKFNKDFLP